MYEATVDDSAGHRIKEIFTHSLPAHLVGPQRQQEDDTRQVQRMIREHTKDLVQRAPFKCVICQMRATRLVHHAACYLSRQPPLVVDIPQPICQKESCDIAAKQQWQQTMLELEKEVQGPIQQSFACQHCGQSAGLQKCSRCLVAAYCSRDCQRAHWRQHKPAC